MSRFAYILTLFLCLRLLAGGEPADYETWTSSDGAEMQARILWVEDGRVDLERSDGMEFSVPVNRFSSESQERIREWSPPPIEVPPVDEVVLILETENGRGSGFLLQEGGRVYVYTNQHVVGDLVSLEAKDIQGRSIELGDLQIARDRDLARFPVEERRGLKLVEETLRSGSEIVVFGNSQGSGVITRDEGTILGLSGEALEVSSEIVAGYSGGPVVNSEGRVVGVSSHVTFGDSELDPTVKGTRFEDPRRFALRMDGEISFVPINRADFTRAYDSFHRSVTAYDEAMNLTRLIMDSPTTHILENSYNTEDVNRIIRSHNRDVATAAGSGLFAERTGCGSPQIVPAHHSQSGRYSENCRNLPRNRFPGIE